MSHRRLTLYRPTPEQWFSEDFVQTLATSEPLGWNSVSVRSAKLSPTTEFVATPHTIKDTLVLTLEGSTLVEGHAVGRYFKKHVSTGSLMTYPRGCNQSDGRWDSPVIAFFVEMSRDGLADVADSIFRGDPDHVEILLSIGFHDFFLRQLCNELYHELHNQGFLGPLFAESVTNTILLHLLRQYSNISTLRQISRGKLTPAQLRIVDEYVQTHLDRKIALSDLAGCVRMSVPHFERMFRAALHCPPYSYVLKCRIDRAKSLLGATHLSVSAVAQDCGFADQAHFTRHFTKSVGVSPAHFARSIRK